MKERSSERAYRSAAAQCGLRAATVLIVLVSLATVVPAGDVADAARSWPSPVARYTSTRLEVHTDLPAVEARQLVRRLEATLAKTARYWRRPCDRRIVCFVADDLTAWPDDALPNPQARLVLEHVRGGMEVLAADGSRSQPEAHVYATSERGIAEHELVHAYCLLTFGTCGPEWYKEGMAEMAYHGHPGDKAVRCSRDVARLLRRERHTPIHEIVGAGSFTQPIADRISALSPRLSGSEASPLRWRSADDAILREARRSYHRSWALCHFLASNPNYSERFRQLGIGYLDLTGVTFDQMFGPIEQRLAMEFRLFLRDIEDGYRVDLCRWDWDSPFTPLSDGESRSTRILAARGFQPAGILVAEGQEYAYDASGCWTTCRRHDETTADGSYFGRGRLEGVILHDYSLGKPFELGSQGSFVAEGAGKLYLRCHDDWHKLADNSGSVEVRLWRKAGDASAP